MKALKDLKSRYYYWVKFGASFGTPTLHEKELRIALICFGGASLAVYTHGITKEFLKLTAPS